jgi:uncharacterized repeat protein (TIGR01451 family)
MRSSGKNRTRRLGPFLVVFAVVMLILAMPTAAAAKSMYVVANHHTAGFDAWGVNPDGSVTYQATYTLQYATDPAAIALDADSETLFITSEFSTGVEMVDPVSLTYLGVSTGPSDFAGLDIDDVNDIVYTVQRMTPNLYIFAWDPIAKTLTETNQISLANCDQAMGISLDEWRQTLWVADAGLGVVRAYDTNTWVEDTSKTFAPSHKPVDVKVDRVRNWVFSVSMIGGAWLPPGVGSTLLSKWDVATQTETTVDMGHGGVGLAVDEVTGYVYVTGGTTAGDNIEVWDTSTIPFTEVQDTGVIGNPAGLVIGNASYNPLSLAKNDIIQGAGISVGDTFTYEITFGSPPFDLTNVTVVDTLPAELDFVSATNGGVYDPATHKVVWNLGSIAAGAAVPTLHLDVLVNNNAQVGNTIYNYATIDSDQTPPTTVIDDESEDEPGIPVVEPSALIATIDFDPNTLNLGSQGKVVTVYIELPTGHDVKQIDVSSITLNGTVPALAKPTSVGDHDKDGIPDRMVKFDRAAVEKILAPGDQVEIKIAGKVAGVDFKGSDTIRVIAKGRFATAGSTYAGYAVAGFLGCFVIAAGLVTFYMWGRPLPRRD